MPSVLSLIQSLDFQRLFIEELGWDRPQGAKVVALLNGVEIQAVAQKRGFVVLFAVVSLLDIRVRNRLRRIQREVAERFHEHLLICADPKGQRQVWLWGYRQANGKRRLHREHPFFSSSPPEQLTERVSKVGFGWDEEESLTILDASARVRSSMDASAEVRDFFRKEHTLLAREKLLLEIQAGSIEALHKFAMKNARLAYWASRGCRGHGIDQEELNQIAFWALMRTLKRFNPQYGTLFTTYATTAIQRWCRHQVGRLASFFKMPPNNARDPYWVYVRRSRIEDRLIARHGRVAASDRIRFWAERNQDGYMWQEQVRRGIEVERLGGKRSGKWANACTLVDGMESPVDACAQQEMREKLKYLLTRLHPQDAEIVCRYHGLADFQPHTLEEIGGVFDLTRERIRQRLDRSVKWMAEMQREAEVVCEIRRNNHSVPLFVIPLHPEAMPKAPKKVRLKKGTNGKKADKKRKKEEAFCGGELAKLPPQKDSSMRPRLGGVKFTWSCDLDDQGKS